VRFAGSANAAGEADDGFDLTPMIDVVLLLIIFFMLTAQFAKTVGEPMDLPREAGEKASTAEDASMVIDLSREGVITVAGERMSAATLLQRIAEDLRRTNRTPGDVEVIIRADRTTPAAHLNGLAAELSRLGIRAWRLATASEQGAGGVR
jgi:biopolymer transport protein ExbD